MKLCVALASVSLVACGAEPVGDFELTGGYEDWDSAQSFLGIFEATVSEAADPTNTTTTAPNGRSTLIVPAIDHVVVTFTHPDHLDAAYTVDTTASLGPYTVHGITPARLDEQYAALSLTVDPARAPVAIEVRSFPSDAPLDGVTLALAGADAGFHRDAAGDFVAGATTAGGADILFANVAPGAPALTITAPDGRRCDGPATLDVAAGRLTLATVFCED